MSVRLMSKVFGLDIESGTKLLLLALTDHADDDGHNCWPSVRYLIWKTSLSERHIRRMLSRLREEGVLIPVSREGGGRRFSVIYQINLDVLPAKEPLARESKGLSPAHENGNVKRRNGTNGRGARSGGAA